MVVSSMIGVPRRRVDPDHVVVSAVIRYPSEEVLRLWKVKVPPFPNHKPGVVVADLKYAKMVYTRDHGVHFMCELPHFPRLIAELGAFIKANKIPRINETGLATVVFTPSEYCPEFSMAAEKARLEGNRWDVFKNHFMTYSL